MNAKKFILASFLRGGINIKLVLFWGCDMLCDMLNFKKKETLIKRLNSFCYWLLWLVLKPRVEKTLTGSLGTLSPLDYKDYGFEKNAKYH